MKEYGRTPSEGEDLTGPWMSDGVSLSLTFMRVQICTSSAALGLLIASSWVPWLKAGVL